VPGHDIQLSGNGVSRFQLGHGRNVTSAIVVNRLPLNAQITWVAVIAAIPVAVADSVETSQVN
jgi:hypothetical protein